ncbi:hypothetical protein [Pseudoduganella aquatica]|uniref:Lipoprotein n=1 Tax=Pseudoduganella aquatica TaxID=2660641 RepID=A0A7X4KKV7_9BURK|nr:hypothetical protein [Pseudoduganella aquatica]MYN07494.1 hypothetical protein [Pseudoduganella aquatica]
MKQLIKPSALAAGIAAIAAVLSGCGAGDYPGPAVPQSGPPPPTVPVAVKITADFGQSIEGWKGESTDYGDGDAPDFVVFEQRTVDAPLTGKGYYMAGHNRSDDMFLYVKKQFGGFVPSTSYKVTFSVKFSTDVSSGCSGVGGAPGESVFVIGAASATEPKSVLKDGRNTLNLDRGNQGTGGKDGQVLGNIGNTQECGVTKAEFKTVKSAEPLIVKTDADGKMWLLAGIDSGFEAASRINIQTVVVDADPVK